MMKMLFGGIVLIAGLFVSSGVSAGDVTIPNSFSAGNTTSASDINQNFSVIETAVDDNDARLDAIESGSTNVVFQGFSSGTFAGNQGLRQLQSACDATFTGSKMCNSEEYANSTYNASAANLGGSAWLLPSSDGGSSSKARDAITGEAYQSGKLSCSCYSGGTPGLAVSAAGGISSSSCSTTQAVACCK